MDIWRELGRSSSAQAGHLEHSSARPSELDQLVNVFSVEQLCRSSASCGTSACTWPKAQESKVSSHWNLIRHICSLAISGIDAEFRHTGFCGNANICGFLRSEAPFVFRLLAVLCVGKAKLRRGGCPKRCISVQRMQWCRRRGARDARRMEKGRAEGRR